MTSLIFLKKKAEKLSENKNDKEANIFFSKRNFFQLAYFMNLSNLYWIKFIAR
jgi:hypothetical protein